MSYEGIRITEELSESVQRAVGITPQRHETLAELVRDIAAQRGVRQPEDLISEHPTRHEVRVDDQIFHTYCFLDALMLPFVMLGERFEVRSKSPMSGREVTGFVGRGRRVLRRCSGGGGTGPRDALPLSQRLPLPRRVRDLGGKDATGYHRRPLAGGGVRPGPRLGIRWTRASRGDGLRLLRSGS